MDCTHPRRGRPSGRLVGAARPVVIVTGAASGIGRAIAERLLADGARLALCDLDASLTETFAAEIASGDVVARVGDVSADGEADALVGAALAAFGQLDGLVNNAATGGPGAEVSTLDLDALRRTLDINVVALVALVQAATPALTRAGGSIVNLGSVFATEPVRAGGAYCMSKGAVHTLTRVLAIELGGAGVRCNTVAPGYILTKMHEDEVAGQAAELGIAVDERFAQLRAEVPLQRHGTPADIAGAVAWLLGPDSAYVTGQSIPVNGGIQFS
nr:SDR family oxidoreductase [Leucobacter sp. cx-169]